MKNSKLISACLKISLSLVLLLNSFLSHAQNDAVRQEIDHFFGNVDKTQVFTKLLKEYGYQFVNVATYNGVLADRLLHT